MALLLALASSFFPAACLTATLVPELTRGLDAEVHYVAGVGHALDAVFESPPHLDATVAARIRAFLASVKR